MIATSFKLDVEVLADFAVLSAYGSGLWAMYKHFTIENSVHPWMRIISLLSLVGILWFLYDRIFTLSSLKTSGFADNLGCLALISLFLGFFWWAVSVTRQQRLTLAFSRDQPVFIQTSGPYAWSRHPFYTSYIIFWAAAALGSADRLFWIMPFTMALLYFRAARLEEAKFATSPLSNQYDSYRIKTAMIIPIPSRPLDLRQIGIVKSDAPPVATSPPQNCSTT